MSLTAAAIRLLGAKGLTVDEIADVAEANSASKVDVVAEKRRAYDRERKRKSTGNPVEVYSDHSTGNSTGVPPETPPLTRVRDITSNSEITGLAVVVEVCADEREPDHWPEGDLAKTLIETIASPRLDPDKSQGLVTTAGRIAAWRRDGASWKFDVLPTIQAAVRKTGPPIGTWKYFDPAIAQSIADNRRALTIPKANVHELPRSDKRTAKDANYARAFAAADVVADGYAERR